MITTSNTFSVRPAAGRAWLVFWEKVASDWQTARNEGQCPESSDYIARHLRALREAQQQTGSAQAEARPWKGSDTTR
jgi:hypothetical protein